jgi:hypothetical protein
MTSVNRAGPRRPDLCREVRQRAAQTPRAVVSPHTRGRMRIAHRASRAGLDSGDGRPASLVWLSGAAASGLPRAGMALGAAGR